MVDVEKITYEECQINIYRNNGKVAVMIEHSKPSSLIALSAFIKILGEPESHCYEDGDWGVLFLFQDKQVSDIIREKWADVLLK